MGTGQSRYPQKTNKIPYEGEWPLGGTQISIRDSIVVAQAKTVGPREAAEEISRQLASLDLAMIIVPFLARGVDLEAVFGWRVVAAIAGVGEDAPETDADLPLQVRDDGGQRVAAGLKD